MKQRPRSPKPHADIEIVRLVWLAIFISIFSFLSYNRQGAVLLYGDAVAHINIARRIFDSRTPGLLQLGTVWLPLPHLLILPFIVSRQMWQSGTGGSIPSMAAFVLGVLGIFRLVRTALSVSGEGKSITILSAWAAAILYAANPNLIYMQATAMGESLYLALFIWSIVYFVEFVQGRENALIKCGFCLAAASLTRYDGWFFAVFLVIVALVRYYFHQRRREEIESKPAGRSPMLLAKFILIAAAAPALWLAYNALVYRNPLEFANGPYSAKAIERKTATVNPANGNLVAAASYFLKAAELNVSQSNWQGRFWLALALLGSAVTLYTRRGLVALLLWVPLPFYALSIAYGSVPIFVPPWWPFARYNLRYGLQLLPAFAVFVPQGFSFLVQRVTDLNRIRAAARPFATTVTVLAILLFAASSYAAIWRVDPICYQEADLNMKGRVALDRQLGEWIKSLPPNSTLLMYLGEHVGALERAGIPLQRTINEGNHRVWKQPSDPEGLWERALANPARYADYAIGFQGDPVWDAGRNHKLAALVEIHTTGQSSAVIFQGRAAASPRNSPQ